MDFESIRRQFPIKSRMVYLNNASIGPLSLPVIEAVNRFLADVRDNGRNNYPKWCDKADNHIKERIAAFLGARRSEIAFVKNTTEGLLIVANGIDWKPGDNVIIADIEYPSNVYCWMNLKRRGVTIRWIKTRNGRFNAKDIEPLIDARTRLVSCSSVQFLNGFRVDLGQIGELCRRKGVMLNIDAIQHIGALALKVSDYPIDFLSAGGHKWLTAPIGTGIFYCRQEALERIHPANIGYHSVRDKSEDDIEYDLTLKPDAGRFEEALVNFPGVWGLDAAVEIIAKLGIRRIEAHIMSLNAAAREGLLARKYEIVSPSDEKQRSGILCFRHPGIATESLWERLHQARIHLAIRGGALRCSPSYYNDGEEIEAMLEALP
jgi:selenocysteine lyase/cysteine desulfurase